MKIGFIGLGTMGASMAARLQAAGHDLVVHDVRKASADQHLAAGAVWAEDPKSLAASCGVVFTSLPGPPEIEQVALADSGLLSGMRPGTAWFDLSTNAPEAVRRLHTVFADRQISTLDAPVSGGARGAVSGKLAIWVGGSRDVFDTHKALLDAIGDQARYVGPIGAASVAKLMHNCAGAAITCVLAEVFTLGAKAGVDPLTLFDALRQGSLGRRRTFDGLVDQFLPGKFDPPSFALGLMHKDVALATTLGRSFGVPMRMANLAQQEMVEALGRGWGNRDTRAMTLLQQERAGVKIEVDAAQLAEVVANDGKR